LSKLAGRRKVDTPRQNKFLRTADALPTKKISQVEKEIVNTKSHSAEILAR
jgi:hypothetical protein